MANVFSGSEIVGFGIQIEKNGRDFYNASADKAASRQVKEIFKFLLQSLWRLPWQKM